MPISRLFIRFRKFSQKLFKVPTNTLPLYFDFTMSYVFALNFPVRSKYAEINVIKHNVGPGHTHDETPSYKLFTGKMTDLYAELRSVFLIINKTESSANLLHLMKKYVLYSA